MDLHVIKSGSTGNCYVLQNKKEALVIEAGLPFSKVNDVVNFKPSKIQACVISHKHSDHAAYADQFIKRGIRIITNPETAETLTQSSLVISAEERVAYKAGGFTILGFYTPHDVPCYFYLIRHNECGVIAFITDTQAVQYSLPRVNFFMIEANYDDTKLAESLYGGEITRQHYDKTRATHMNITETEYTLANSDLSNTFGIMLIHLSKANADANDFIKRIKRLTGKPTYVAGYYPKKITLDNNFLQNEGH